MGDVTSPTPPGSMRSSPVPAKTERQRRLMAAEHERVEEGKSPRATKGMTQKQREHYMHKSKGSKK